MVTQFRGMYLSIQLLLASFYLFYVLHYKMYVIYIFFFQHGSVVMLYHPCTHPVLVQRMRTVLKSCLFRHIITPYNLVPEDRVRMIHTVCA